ncbi:MAG: hypothetical protein V1904_07625 [Bacteroidota bacterium]
MKQIFLTFKKNYPSWLLFLFCLPLLFINIKSSHDWGDDYASYIHQAKNIIEGIPQSSLGYVLNQDSPGIGPPAYPIGFPLLLAPVYCFFGNSISAYTVFLSLLLIFAALLMYRFFKFYFSALTSFFLVLIIVYNPWTLNFKMEVMSEIPFTLFLLIIIILYHFRKEKSNYFFYIFIGFLGGFLMSVRSAGSVLIFAVLTEIILCVYQFRKKDTYNVLMKKSVWQKIILIIAALLTYALLNVLLFRTPSSGFFYYTSVFTFDALSQVVRDNLAYNFSVFKNFFANENNDWQFLPIFTQSALLTFAVIGFIKKISMKLDFIDLLVIFYCLFILIYPYGNAGFRFILPIVPVLFYYALIAVKDINIPFKSVNRKVIIILIGALIIVQYKVGIEKIINQQNKVLWGPQEENAAEAFTYIRNNVSENALIDFVKPRALALYAERSSYHMKPDQSMQGIKENIEKDNISYILYTDEPINFLPEDSLKKFISLNNNLLVCEWSNNKFKLYRIVR